MLIGIASDDYTAPNQPPGFDAASGRWQARLEELGCDVRSIDVRLPDVLSQLDGCDGFMWRWAHFGGMGRIARRLLPVVERVLNIATYPDQNTCWHYDDKIAQAFLFDALEIPAPKTWIFFDHQEAISWIRQQSLPLVVKLATGAGSSNVKIILKPEEGVQTIDHLFSFNVEALLEGARFDLINRAKIFRDQVIFGRGMRSSGYDLQTGYVIFQEFLKGNDYDTRITVIGRRAFGFRRWNRTGDFRASGSGDIDFDVSEIDQRFVRLAFLAAQRLGMQSCAIDGLWRGDEPVVGEVSYTYVHGVVQQCLGHWELEGDPETGELIWVDGHMWPEYAQVEDFLQRIQERKLHAIRVSHH